MRACLYEQIDSLSLEEIEQRLSILPPNEFISPSQIGDSDWVALTLFPFVEFAVAKHCVFSPKGVLLQSNTLIFRSVVICAWLLLKL